MNPRQHNYATVIEWDEKRTREFSGMLKPYLKVIDAYADLVCEIVDVIGTEKPVSTQDIVVRDLLADVSMHLSKRAESYSPVSAARPIQ